MLRFLIYVVKVCVQSLTYFLLIYTYMTLGVGGVWENERSYLENFLFCVQANAPDWSRGEKWITQIATVMQGIQGNPREGLH